MKGDSRCLNYTVSIEYGCFVEGFFTAESGFD